MTNNAIPGTGDLNPAMGPNTTPGQVDSVTTTYPSDADFHVPGGTGIIMYGWCRWCSSELSKVYHGGRCPEVEEIEYFENGSVRRVKFRSGS